MTKTAFLTIDDAPSMDMVRKVDYLSRKGVPAVFFCSGNALEQRPEAALHALERGFVLGNHGYDHPPFSSLSLEACREQIRRTDELLAGLYARAGLEWREKYFRFPYGDKGGLRGPDVFEPYSEVGLARKDAIQAYLRELGYGHPPFTGITRPSFLKAGLLDDRDWYWTYDVMEWSVFAEQPMFGIDSVEKVFARMDEEVPEGGRGLDTPGSDEIILTHDHTRTAAFFVPIIERLLAKGLVFAVPR